MRTQKEVDAEQGSADVFAKYATLEVSHAKRSRLKLVALQNLSVLWLACRCARRGAAKAADAEVMDVTLDVSHAEMSALNECWFVKILHMLVTPLTSHVPMGPVSLGLLLQLVPAHAQLPVADSPTHSTTAALRSALMVLLHEDGGPSFVEDAGSRV